MVSKRSCGWAVDVLNRAAGHHAAWEAPPPPYVVTEAQLFLASRGRLDYLECLLAAGRALPRPAPGNGPAEFEALLRRLEEHDVDGWWAGVVSGKCVTVPKPITDAFVQRAGGKPGVEVPGHRRVVQPIMAAEGRVRIVEQATWQPIVPRAVAGDADEPLKIFGDVGRVHRETIRLSRWLIVGGWDRPVGGPPRGMNRPAGPIGAAATLIPPTAKKAP